MHECYGTHTFFPFSSTPLYLIYFRENTRGAPYHTHTHTIDCRNGIYYYYNDEKTRDPVQNDSEYKMPAWCVIDREQNIDFDGNNTKHDNY